MMDRAEAIRLAESDHEAGFKLAAENPIAVTAAIDVIDRDFRRAGINPYGSPPPDALLSAFLVMFARAYVAQAGVDVDVLSPLVERYRVRGAPAPLKKLKELGLNPVAAARAVVKWLHQPDIRRDALLGEIPTQEPPPRPEPEPEKDKPTRAARKRPPPEPAAAPGPTVVRREAEHPPEPIPEDLPTALTPRAEWTLSYVHRETDRLTRADPDLGAVESVEEDRADGARDAIREIKLAFHGAGIDLDTIEAIPLLRGFIVEFARAVQVATGGKVDLHDILDRRFAEALSIQPRSRPRAGPRLAQARLGRAAGPRQLAGAGLNPVVAARAYIAVRIAPENRAAALLTHERWYAPFVERVETEPTAREALLRRVLELAGLRLVESEERLDERLREPPAVEVEPAASKEKEAESVAAPTSEVTLPAAPAPAPLPRILAPTPEIIRKYEQEFRSANTRRNYASQLRVYARWAGAHGHPTMPATAETMTAWVVARAEAGQAASSIAVGIAAMSMAHELAELPDPTDDKHFRRVWEGVMHTIGTAPRRQAAPLLPDALKRFTGLPATPDDTSVLRDRALLLVAFGAALRQSEATALRVEDVVFEEEGMTITIRRSKTDQKGKSHETSIPKGAPPTDPVSALQAWLRAADIATGPIFRRVFKGGKVGDRALSTRAVEDIVKAAVLAIGDDPTKFSGHSMRAGLATAATDEGVPLAAIAEQGRWERLDTVMAYVRRRDRYKGNAAAGLL